MRMGEAGADPGTLRREILSEGGAAWQEWDSERIEIEKGYAYGSTLALSNTSSIQPSDAVSDIPPRRSH